MGRRADAGALRWQALALAQMTSSLALATAAIDKGAVPALARVVRGARDTPSREGRACLAALAALARGGGAAAAEAVVTDAAALRCLLDALAASDVATRSEAAGLVSAVAQPLLQRRHAVSHFTPQPAPCSPPCPWRLPRILRSARSSPRRADAPAPPRLRRAGPRPLGRRLRLEPRAPGT